MEESDVCSKVEAHLTIFVKDFAKVVRFSAIIGLSDLPWLLATSKKPMVPFHLFFCLVQIYALLNKYFHYSIYPLGEVCERRKWANSSASFGQQSEPVMVERCSFARLTIDAF